MIDPQLQGIKWIKNKYGDQLVVLRLTQKNYLDRIEHAIANGDVVLLENIAETIDAVLDPILGRVLIKRGRYTHTHTHTQIYVIRAAYFSLIDKNANYPTNEIDLEQNERYTN